MGAEEKADEMSYMMELHEARKSRLARFNAAAAKYNAGLNSVSAPALVIEAEAIEVETPVRPRPRMKYWFWPVPEAVSAPVDIDSIEVTQILVKDIQIAVAAHFNVTCIDLISERRTANLVRPRQLAMYLAKKLTTRSTPQIGRQFGDRDHSTVLHAIRKVDERIKSDPEFASEVQLIRTRLENDHAGHRNDAERHVHAAASVAA